MDAPNLHRRLNKILGQVKAIDKMVDEDVPCEEILIQINAVKGAMHRVGQGTCSIVSLKALKMETPKKRSKNLRMRWSTSRAGLEN